MRLGRLLIALYLSFPVFAFDLHEAAPEKHKDMIWSGHVVPDTDAVAAAVGAAELYGGQPAVAGKISAETHFVLKTCGVDQLSMVTDVTFQKAGLIDFNDVSELHKNIRQDQVVAIIDHHAISGGTISRYSPISVDIRPWGASASIVADNYFRLGRIPRKSTACVMLGGILSDTLTFTKATTTRYDQEVAQKFGVEDLEEFGHSMLVAKSDLDSLSAADILMTDYKRYVVNGKTVGFGVAETLKAPSLLQRKDEFMKALADIKANQGIDYIFFSVTDVRLKHANMLPLGKDEQQAILAAFGKTASASWVQLDGLTSRKVHLMPRLRKAIEEM